MRALATLVLLSSATTLPALAQDRKFYAGGELGLAVSTGTDLEITPATTAGTTGNISTDHDLGFQGSAFAGHDFGTLRVEAEYSHLTADVDELTSDFSHANGLVAGAQSAGGKARVRSLMVNVLADFGQPDSLSFFVGAGAGKAQVKLSSVIAAEPRTTLLDHSDRRFAWQGFAGVRKPLTGNLEAHLRYRYLHVGSVQMVGFGGRAMQGKVDSHSLAAGITYRFAVR